MDYELWPALGHPGQKNQCYLSEEACHVWKYQHFVGAKSAVVVWGVVGVDDADLDLVALCLNLGDSGRIVVVELSDKD